MINPKKIFFKKFKVTLSSFFGMSMVALSACAPPINHLSGADQSFVYDDKNLPEYRPANFSKNYSKKINVVWPNQIGENMAKWTIYSPDYILKEKKWLNTFNEKITKENIELDIKDSLVLLVQNNNNISINFDSLNIYFEVSQEGVNSNKDINNLEISYEITNKGNNELSLYDNNVILRPKSNSTLKIVVPVAKIMPSYVLGNTKDIYNSAFYMASWELKATSLPIQMSVHYNNELGIIDDIVEFDVIESLNVVQGPSVALNTSFKNFNKSVKATDLSEAAIKKFSELSSEDFMKDVNDWFLYYFKYQFYLAFKDLRTIVDYILSKNTYHKDFGKNVSLLEILMFDKGLRKKIIGYQETKVNKEMLKEIIEHIDNITDQNKGTINAKKMELLLRNIIASDFDGFINKSVKTEIIWKEKPAIDFYDKDNPKISFDFDVKNTFLKDYILKFVDKGKIDGEEIDYDFVEDTQIQKLLKKILKMDGILGAGSLDVASLFDKIIPASFGVLEGESVTLSYRAEQSPLKLSLAPTFDYNKTDKMTLGWVATDTQMAIDLSDINYFIDSLSRKLNIINKNKPVSPKKTDGMSEVEWRHSLLNYQDELTAYNSVYNPKKGVPLKKYSELSITNIIDKISNEIPNDIYSIISLLNDGFNNPIKSVFRSLLKRGHSLNSYKMNVNLSRAFYSLPDNYWNKKLWNEKIVDDKIYVSQSEDVDLASVEKAVVSEKKENEEIETTKGNDVSEAISIIGQNAKNFNFNFKDEQMKKIAQNYNASFYDETNLNNLTLNMTEKIVKEIDNQDSDQKITSTAFTDKIIDLYKQNFKNTWVESKDSSDEDKKTRDHFNPTIDPKVTVLKFDLKAVLNELVQQDLSFKNGEIKFIADLLTNHWFFGIQIFDITKLPDSLIKRNPMLILINPQTNNVSMSVFFVPPIIKTNSIAKDLLAM